VPDDIADAYFEDRGFGFRMEGRELHAELIAKGESGRASFFRECATYQCVHLTRGGRVVAPDYAYGETREEALADARRRYRREQE
jgi:hypothetical protein